MKRPKHGSLISGFETSCAHPEHLAVLVTYVEIKGISLFVTCTSLIVLKLLLIDECSLFFHWTVLAIGNFNTGASTSE